jgi:hypothetical protein
MTTWNKNVDMELINRSKGHRESYSAIQQAGYTTSSPSKKLVGCCGSTWSDPIGMAKSVTIYLPILHMNVTSQSWNTGPRFSHGPVTLWLLS